MRFNTPESTFSAGSSSPRTLAILTRLALATVAAIMLVGAFVPSVHAQSPAADDSGAVFTIVEHRGDRAATILLGDAVSPAAASTTSTHPCQSNSDNLFKVDKPVVDLYAGASGADISEIVTTSLGMAVAEPLDYIPNTIFGDLPDWLTVELLTTKGVGETRISANVTNLQPGAYTATFSIVYEWENGGEATPCDMDPITGVSSWYTRAVGVRVRVELRVGDCTPVIGAITTDPAPAEMGRPYTMNVRVRLHDKCNENVAVTLSSSETAWRSSYATDLRGDELQTIVRTPGGAASETRTLAPGQSTNFVFTGIHTWGWLADEAIDSCTDILRLSKVNRWNISPTVDVLDHFMNLLQREADPQLDLARTYAMRFRIVTDQAVDSQYDVPFLDPRALQVEVDQVKQLAYAKMIHGYMEAGKYSSTSAFFDPTGGGISGGGLMTLPTAMGGVANWRYICPLTKFVVGDVIWDDVWPSAFAATTLPKSLVAAPDSSGKRLAIALFEANAHSLNALAHMVAAQDAGADDYEGLLQQAEADMAQYKTVLASMDGLMEDYLADLEAEEQEIGAGSKDYIVNLLTNHGFGEATRTLFRDSGFTDSDIASITQRSIEQAAYFEGTWTDNFGNSLDQRAGLAAQTQFVIDALRASPPDGGEQTYVVHLPAVFK